MLQELNLILEGQSLRKDKDFPAVVARSNQYLELVVEGIPNGYVASAYFTVSWASGVFDKPFSGKRCAVDEYLTTLPENPSEYYDYKLSVSLACFAGDKKFTTNPVEIIIDKTNYADSTENTPEIPQSQYEGFVKEVLNAVENVPKVDDATISSETTWSSKNTVDKLCRPIEETGSAVACYPVENYPLAVQTEQPLNLIPQPYETTKSYGTPWTRGGITFTDSGDGSITVDGEAESDVSFQLMYYGQLSGVEVGDVLRLGGCPSGGDGAYRLHAYLSNGGTDTGNSAEFAVEEWMVTSQALDIDIIVSAGTVCDNLVFWPRLTKAADTPTTVTRCGKNLIPYAPKETTTVNGVTYTVNKDGSVTMSGTATANSSRDIFSRFPAAHLVGQQVTIPQEKNSTTAIYCHLHFADGTDTWNWLRSDETCTAVVPDNVVKMTVGCVAYTGFSSEGKTLYPQLELGNTPTAFEPYREPQTFPVAPDGTATVPAAAGCNTLWADKGTITVTGAEDPRHTIERLEAAIISLGGNV